MVAPASLRALALASLTLAPGVALADDLREALVLAYNTNPTLQAARAQQRALDETVPIEKADGRPAASGTATYTEILDRSDSSPISPTRQFGANISLGVPLYAGGGIKNSIRSAETRVEAGQADLRATESFVFSRVVAAYMDVIQNQAIVGLSRKNVEVLKVNLQATKDRFEIGDLTRTDVAQSQARLAVAQGSTRSAEANLANSRERYIELVGKAPVDLAPPPPLPGFPANAEEAVAYALDHNPDLLAARERVKASEYDIAVAGSTRLPRIEAFTGATHSNLLNSAGAIFDNTSTGATVGVRATIPLFQGGRPAALRRQAQERSAAAMETEIGAEREVVSTVRAAWQSWQAANEIILSSQTAVEAAQLSLEGVRAENTVGNRTILDILNAEQELLNAQVQLVTARRNAYVAGFTLLAAMGKAEARDLGLDGGTFYDPEANYNAVKGKWFDWDDNPAPTARSTRTVDTRPQDGSIPAQ
jgi:outer membrane protein